MLSSQFRYRSQWAHETAESEAEDDLNDDLETTSGSDTDDLAHWSSDDESGVPMALVEREPVHKRRKGAHHRRGTNLFGVVKSRLKRALLESGLLQQGYFTHFGKNAALGRYTFVFQGKTREHAKWNVSDTSDIEEAVKQSFRVISRLDFSIGESNNGICVEGSLLPLPNKHEKRCSGFIYLLDLLFIVFLLSAIAKHFHYLE